MSLSDNPALAELRKKRVRIFRWLYWGGWGTGFSILVPLVILKEFGVMGTPNNSIMGHIAFVIVCLSAIAPVVALWLGTFFWSPKDGEKGEL